MLRNSKSMGLLVGIYKKNKNFYCTNYKMPIFLTSDFSPFNPKGYTLFCHYKIKIYEKNQCSRNQS